MEDHAKVTKHNTKGILKPLQKKKKKKTGIDLPKFVIERDQGSALKAIPSYILSTFIS